MQSSLFVFMILCTCQVESLSLEGKQLVGSIEFQDASELPEKLAEGSCLNVALKDSPDFTTAAKEIARITDKDVKDSYDKDKTLKYKIDLPDMKLTEKKTYLVSAVLNIGWCKEDSDKIDSGKWIGDRDFLTDTPFFVEGLDKCSKESSQMCHGPKLSLVRSQNDDKNKEQDDEDKGKGKEKDKDDR